MHQFPVTRSEEEWRELLTPEQYAVMRGHGTERPGSCALLHEKRAGTFSCVGCDQPLFEAKVEVRERHRLAELQRAGAGVGRDHDATAATAWCAPRCIAPPAAAISATSSPTGRRRPACATASTAWR